MIFPEIDHWINHLHLTKVYAIDMHRVGKSMDEVEYAIYYYPATRIEHWVN